MSIVPRMLKDSAGPKVAIVMAIQLLSAFLSFLCTWLAGTTLEKNEVGKLNLILIVVLVLTDVAIIGQNAGIVRFFGKEKPGNFSWRRSFALLLVPLFALVGVGVAVCTFIYELSTLEVAIIIISTCSNLILLLHSSLLRALGRVEISAFFLHLSNALYVVLLAGLWFLDIFSLTGAIVLFGISRVVVAVCTERYTAVTVAQGSASVPARMHIEGMLLGGVSAIYSVDIRLDTLFIGASLSLTELGTYAIVQSLAKVFGFFASALGFVLMPFYMSKRRIHLVRDSLYVMIPCALLALAYLLLGTRVLHFLFKGKYDSGGFLFVYFTVAGVFNVLHSVAMTLIYAVATKGGIGQFAGVSAISMGVSAGLFAYLVPRYNLEGAAVALTVGWALRWGLSYLVASGCANLHFSSKR